MSISAPCCSHLCFNTTSAVELTSPVHQSEHSIMRMMMMMRPVWDEVLPASRAMLLNRGRQCALKDFIFVFMFILFRMITNNQHCCCFDSIPEAFCEEFACSPSPGAPQLLVAKGSSHTGSLSARCLHAASGVGILMSLRVLFPSLQGFSDGKREAQRATCHGGRSFSELHDRFEKQKTRQNCFALLQAYANL